MPQSKRRVKTNKRRKRKKGTRKQKQKQKQMQKVSQVVKIYLDRKRARRKKRGKKSGRGGGGGSGGSGGGGGGMQYVPSVIGNPEPQMIMPPYRQPQQTLSNVTADYATATGMGGRRTHHDPTNVLAGRTVGQLTDEERAILSQEQELAKVRAKAANRAMDLDRVVENKAVDRGIDRMAGAEEVGGLLDPAGNDLDQPPLTRGQTDLAGAEPMLGERATTQNYDRTHTQATLIDRQAELKKEEAENRAKFEAEQKKKRSDAAKLGWERRQELDRLVEEEDQKRNSSWSSGQSITLTDSQQIDLARTSAQQPLTNNGFQPLPPVTPKRSVSPPTINRNTTMPDSSTDSSTDSSLARDNVLDDYFRSSTNQSTGVITFPTIQAFDQNTVQPSADPNELSRSEIAARNAATDAAHAAELSKYQPSVGGGYNPQGGDYPEATQSNDDLLAQLDEENAATDEDFRTGDEWDIGEINFENQEQVAPLLFPTYDALGRDTNWEHIDDDAGSYADSLDWSVASDTRDLKSGSVEVEPPNPRFTNEDSVDWPAEVNGGGDDDDNVNLGSPNVSPAVSPRNTVLRGVNSQPRGAVQPEFELPPNRATPIPTNNLGAGNIFSTPQSRARAAALARNEAMMMM